MNNLKKSFCVLTLLVVIAVSSPASAAPKGGAPRSFLAAVKAVIVRLLEDGKLTLPPG
jgi:hypothetical protein